MRWVGLLRGGPTAPIVLRSRCFVERARRRGVPSFPVTAARCAARGRPRSVVAWGRQLVRHPRQRCRPLSSTAGRSASTSRQELITRSARRSDNAVLAWGRSPGPMQCASGAPTSSSHTRARRWLAPANARASTFPDQRVYRGGSQRSSPPTNCGPPSGIATLRPSESLARTQTGAPHSIADRGFVGRAIPAGFWPGRKSPAPDPLAQCFGSFASAIQRAPKNTSVIGWPCSLSTLRCAMSRRSAIGLSYVPGLGGRPSSRWRVGATAPSSRGGTFPTTVRRSVPGDLRRGRRRAAITRGAPERRHRRRVGVFDHGLKDRSAASGRARLRRDRRRLGYSVARRSDGSVVAWGDNNSGQCDVPVLPAGLTYVEVAAGNYHVVARRSDGSVVVWGSTRPVSATCRPFREG